MIRLKNRRDQLNEARAQHPPHPWNWKSTQTRIRYLRIPGGVEGTNQTIRGGSASPTTRGQHQVCSSSRTARLCCDYRALSKLRMGKSEPLRHIETYWYRWAEHKIFSKFTWNGDPSNPDEDPQWIVIKQPLSNDHYPKSIHQIVLPEVMPFCHF